MAEMGLKVVVLSRDVSNEPELAPYVKSGNLIVRKAGEDSSLPLLVCKLGMFCAFFCCILLSFTWLGGGCWRDAVCPDAEPWRDFLKLVESCRAVFTPCVSDASPRVAAEAMSKGTAVLMNWHIVGGWKYINDKTGVFFHDEHDIKQAIEKLRSPDFQKGLNPRQWFIDNWGPHNSGVRLQAFLEITLGKDRLAEARAMRTSHRRRLG